MEVGKDLDALFHMFICNRIQAHDIRAVPALAPTFMMKYESFNSGKILPGCHAIDIHIFKVMNEESNFMIGNSYSWLRN